MSSSSWPSLPSLPSLVDSDEEVEEVIPKLKPVKVVVPRPSATGSKPAAGSRATFKSTPVPVSSVSDIWPGKTSAVISSPTVPKAVSSSPQTSPLIGASASELAKIQKELMHLKVVIADLSSQAHETNKRIADMADVVHNTATMNLEVYHQIPAMAHLLHQINVTVERLVARYDKEGPELDMLKSIKSIVDEELISLHNVMHFQKDLKVLKPTRDFFAGQLLAKHNLPENAEELPTWINSMSHVLAGKFKGMRRYFFDRIREYCMAAEGEVSSVDAERWVREIVEGERIAGDRLKTLPGGKQLSTKEDFAAGTSFVAKFLGGDKPAEKVVVAEPEKPEKPKKKKKVTADKNKKRERIAITPFFPPGDGTSTKVDTVVPPIEEAPVDSVPTTPVPKRTAGEVSISSAAALPEPQDEDADDYLPLLDGDEPMDEEEEIVNLYEELDDDEQFQVMINRSKSRSGRALKPSSRLLED